MTTHSNVFEVQEEGCLALGSLARDIAENHGIEAIVSAMKAHSNISEVRQFGCLALFNLCFNDSVAARMQFKGALAVLEQNPSNSYAKKALQRINALLILG
jgi:hypothetical protein